MNEKTIGGKASFPLVQYDVLSGCLFKCVCDHDRKSEGNKNLKD